MPPIPRLGSPATNLGLDQIQRLPLAPLTGSTPAPHPARIAVALVNERSRIAARRIFDHLHWHPGQPVHYIVQLGGPIEVQRAEPGTSRYRLDARGHLHLPASARRAGRIQAGSEVLLIAALDLDRVVVLSATTLLSALQTTLAGARSQS